MKTVISLILVSVLLAACASAGAEVQGGNHGSRASVGGTVFRF